MADRGPARTASGGVHEHPEEGAFQMLIRMLPNIAPRQELVFEQQLARYLQERELFSDGTPLAMTIRSDSRELTVTDQVGLMAWVMLWAPVATVKIGQPIAASADFDSSDGGHGAVVSFQASRCDLALPPVLQLYRLGRLRAQQVAEVLAA